MNPPARWTWPPACACWRRIVTANEELRTTTLLITHNADIAQMGDRVVRFADGMIRSIERNAARRRPGELHW